MMGPSRGDTICGNVAIDALGPMQFGALVLGPIHIAHTPTHAKIWLVTVERTLLPRSVDVSRFMAGVGELANATIAGAVPIVLVDREADFCVVGYRALDGARTLAAIAEAGEDREAAAALAGQLAETLAAIHAVGAVHGVVTPTTVVHDGRRWWTWEHGIVAHCSSDRLGPRMRPLGGDIVAPELRAGTGLSAASDVFAWGAAVACLLTGASGADAVAMIQDDEDDGDPLRELVRAALEPIAELRPRDAATLCDRLRTIGVYVGVAPRAAVVAAPPSASESAEFSFADLNEPGIEEIVEEPPAPSTPKPVPPSLAASSLSPPSVTAPNVAAPNVTAPNAAAPNVAAPNVAGPKVVAPPVLSSARAPVIAPPVVPSATAPATAPPATSARVALASTSSGSTSSPTATYPAASAPDLDAAEIDAVFEVEQEPEPPASDGAADDLVELLDLDTDSHAIDIPAPAAKAERAASDRTPPVSDGGPDTSERWRALAEQYLATEIADEKPSGEIELTEVPAADRRAVEALGRVTLVRARVRSGAQRVITHDGASVSGTFDMSDEPDPDPEVPPPHIEGARDLPLGAPHHDEAGDWDEGDEAVFDLDAPGMPRVDSGANDVDISVDDEGAEFAEDERRIRDTIAPWNEPTPVDGLGTRRHAAARAAAEATEALEDTGPSPALAPTVPPTAEPKTPKPAPRPSTVVVASKPATVAPPSATPETTTGRGLSVRTTPAEDLRATPIDPFAEAPPVPPARARPQESPSGDRGPRLVPDRVVVRRAGAVPGELQAAAPPTTRNGTVVAWALVLSLTAVAIAATLAAARQRGGLSRLLGASAVPTGDANEPDGSDERGTAGGGARDPDAVPHRECPTTMRHIDGTPGVCIDEAEAPGIREIPSNLISLADAREACRARGARLCTAQQWRAACRGPKQWRHPYGARVEHDRCNGAASSGELQDLSRTGARDRCKTPSGIYDLAGNVAEWVDDGAALGGDSSTRAPSCDTRVQPADGAPGVTIGYRCCVDLAASR